MNDRDIHDIKDISSNKIFTWLNRVRPNLITMSGTPIIDKPYEAEILIKLLKEPFSKIDPDLTKLSKSEIQDHISQINESTKSDVQSNQVNNNVEINNSGIEDKSN